MLVGCRYLQFVTERQIQASTIKLMYSLLSIDQEEEFGNKGQKIICKAQRYLVIVVIVRLWRNIFSMWKWTIGGISLKLYKVLKLQNSVWKIIWFPTGSLRSSQTVWEHLRKSMIANLNWRNAGCFLFSFAGLANTICRKFATILSLQSNITLSFHRQSGTVASIYCMENP